MYQGFPETSAVPGKRSGSLASRCRILVLLRQCVRRAEGAKCCSTARWCEQAWARQTKRGSRQRWRTKATRSRQSGTHTGIIGQARRRAARQSSFPSSAGLDWTDVVALSELYCIVIDYRTVMYVMPVSDVKRRAEGRQPFQMSAMGQSKIELPQNEL